jgi:ATP-dependent Clp protease ATP-binding subunit ClpC
VPEKILTIEQQLEDVRELKNSVVKKQKYEEAAKLRDEDFQLSYAVDLIKGLSKITPEK